MKRKITLIAAVYAATGLGLFTAQQIPSILWQKSIGGNSSENVNVIGVSNDGTKFATVGVSYSTDHDAIGNRGSGDALLTIGNIGTGAYTASNLGGSDLDDILGISNTADGGYILAGVTNSNDYGCTTKGLSDSWFVKIDGTGNVLWQKSYGGYFFEWAYKALETADGGFIFAGHTESYDGDVTGPLLGESDIWVGKMNATGDLLWQKKLGGTNVDTSYDIVKAADGGYYVLGTTYSAELPGYKGQGDALVIKINGNGIVEWQKCFGGSDGDMFRQGVVDADGSLVAVGQTFSNDQDLPGNKGGLDYWAIKISPTGDVIWSKNYGGTANDKVFSIDKSISGGYLLGGFTYSNNGDVTGNHGSNDMWILQIDNNGNKVWQKTFGGSNGDLALSIKQVPDGSILAGGVASSLDGDVTQNLGDTDGWLLHLGTPLAVSEAGGKSDVAVFPNPFTAELFIRSDRNIKNAKLVDASGRVVSSVNSSSKDMKIDAANVAKGMYILTVETDKSTETRKVIKK